MSRHQLTPDIMTVPELQNQGSRANAMAGSIPVRVRYQGFWLGRVEGPEANRPPAD